MLLGSRISRTTAMLDWRFVEADLYRICDRVKEYDREAALIRSDATGELGLARRVPQWRMTTQDEYVLARPLGLYGEPDARVIDQMYWSDSHNKDNAEYYAALDRAGVRAAEKAQKNTREEMAPYAQEMAYRFRKDLGRQDRIAV